MSDEEDTAGSDDLGPWLRELRDRARLTQEQVSAAVGAEVRSIRRWENDGDAPSGPTLLKLLSAYGVKIDPPPPASAPRAVNAELRDLRDELPGQVREELERALTSPEFRDVLRAVASELARGDTAGRRRQLERGAPE